MAEIIDGKAAAEGLRQLLKARAERFRADHGIAPGLAVVIVGDHPASRAYVRTKTRVAAEVGIAGELIQLDATVGEAGLLRRIQILNADPTVHGILVQLPLPDEIDARAVLAAIDPRKDVDGFHALNVGALFSASRPDPDRLLVPCTPLGCLLLLRNTLGADGLAGREAVIVGRSNIVGKPMAALLLGADCTVTIAHSRTHRPRRSLPPGGYPRRRGRPATDDPGPTGSSPGPPSSMSASTASPSPPARAGLWATSISPVRSMSRAPSPRSPAASAR